MFFFDSEKRKEIWILGGVFFPQKFLPVLSFFDRRDLRFFKYCTALFSGGTGTGGRTDTFKKI